MENYTSEMIVEKIKYEPQQTKAAETCNKAASQLHSIQNHTLSGSD